MAYTEEQRKRIVEIALQAVEARASGKTKVRLSRVWPDEWCYLEEPGYCNRFVRQVHEAALGLPPMSWTYSAGTASTTIRKLERANKTLPPGVTRQPGDIVGWYDEQGPGHIAIYLGNAYGDGRLLVAENTSASRGYPKAPGTKITQLKNIRKPTGTYRI